VKVIKKGYPTTNCLILGDGFVTVGRYPKEVVAAAILVEKMAKTEVLGSALGKIHYINPLLTKIMHLVYKKRYSRREREAYVKTR
jgi:ribulose-5-phosphate 4-epimerase/fuculose-1-phosphate aldolase